MRCTHQDAGEQGGMCQIWTQSQRVSASPPHTLILHYRLHEEWLTERLIMLPSARWLAGSKTRIIWLLHQPKCEATVSDICVSEQTSQEKWKDPYVSISTQIIYFRWGLPQCCWQLSLLLESCIIRSFCLLSKSAKTARLHGWGRENHWTHGFCWEEGGFWCSSFLEPHSTLWYFIRHFFFLM